MREQLGGCLASGQGQRSTMAVIGDRVCAR